MWEFLQKLMGGAAGAGAAGAPGGLLGAARAGAPMANGMQGPTPMPPQNAVPQQAMQSSPGVGGILGGLMKPETGNKLMDMGAAMMQAGAPSLNPASGSFLGAAGAGMGALSQGSRAYAEMEMKRGLIGAQTGNYEASAASQSAQTEIARQQAEASVRLASELNPQQNTVGGTQMANPTATAPVAPPAAPAGLAPTQGAIDELKSNPGSAGFFDELYGPGASKRYLGGM